MVEVYEKGDANPAKKGLNWSFLAIVAVFILPFFILPLIMSPETMDKSNRGEFVQPHVPIGDIPLKSMQGFDVGEGALSDKWKLLYFMPPVCDASCKNALFTLRQVPQALDRDVGRVESLLVMGSMPDESAMRLVDSQFSSLQRFQSSPDDINRAFREALSGEDVASAGYLYLVSPDGYIFMRYAAYADEQESILKARDIRKDLKTSLKGELEREGE